jgi:ubiquinone/menaquinone biosynthesis C-methylase UbiE
MTRVAANRKRTPSQEKTLSTYVLMRILESSPHRYDFGIRLLTLGRIDRAYDRLTSHIQPGQRVLDIGCGTGALTLRAAKRGAVVKGIDINPEMLAIAAERTRNADLEGNVELAETGVAELDRETSESYDAVTSGLCFSELSEQELSYSLTQVMRIVKPGGTVLVADEVRPQNAPARFALALLRAPLSALTYLVTQQTSHPVEHLPEALAQAGFVIVDTRTSALQSLIEVVARKPDGPAL